MAVDLQVLPQLLAVVTQQMHQNDLLQQVQVIMQQMHQADQAQQQSLLTLQQRILKVETLVRSSAYNGDAAVFNLATTALVASVALFAIYTALPLVMGALAFVGLHIRMKRLLDQHTVNFPARFNPDAVRIFGYSVWKNVL